MNPQRRTILPLSFVLVAALLVTARGAVALEIPAAPTQWVTDRAGILGGTEEDLLNKRLQDFEQQSGAQFIIYTFPSLEGESVEDFTIRTVGRWKVGQKKYDNGLVLFVFAQEKVVRVEVGYGLEGSVTDAFSSRVIREHIAPHFQRGDYGGGLNAAATAIMEKIRTGEAAVPPLEQRRGPQEQGGEDIGIIPVLIILFIIFFVVAPMFSRRRRGRSGCSGCIFPFFFPGGGITFGGGGGGFSSGGFGGGFGGGGGGFSGGGGGFGGGGATGGW
jgi:uncharacterized protein